MFEHFATERDAFKFKLGAALTMERTVLELLEHNEATADDLKLAKLFREHHIETHGHVGVIEEAFAACGWEVEDEPCPSMRGLDREIRANARKSDDWIVDLLLLEGAAEVEHHEIAVYENLITSARALGHHDAVGLFERALEQERRMLGAVRGMLPAVAERKAQMPAT
jgi:ferritin-like metal-binding protein YciE